MLIDTHAHLNFDAFKDDAGDVIRRSLDNEIRIINVGSQYTTSKKAVEIAEKYAEGVYAAVGLHPIHAEENFCAAEYRGFIKSKKVVAIGEIGLDYKPEYLSFKERQREVFLEQLDLAKEFELPVIFHCRFAHNDLVNILNTKYKILNTCGVAHCFTGDWQQAQKYLEMGFYLGFNGIIFKLDLDEIIKKVPLDKILLETDCPYLTPSQEGDKRNEPIYIKYIAEKIATIKNISHEEISKITTENAKKLFNL